MNQYAVAFVNLLHVRTLLSIGRTCFSQSCHSSICFLDIYIEDDKFKECGPVGAAEKVLQERQVRGENIMPA